MSYSKRHLADTVLSHTPHVELLLHDLALAEMRAAKLEALLIDRLTWIHEVDHGHLGRTLTTCRADMCVEYLHLATDS